MPESPKNAPPAAQVLIVEDEPDHAEVMAAALRKPGHVCTIVHGVAQAVEELGGGSFDVIVTDLRMPGSAGYAAAGGRCRGTGATRGWWCCGRPGGRSRTPRRSW
ncbi:MAG: response regulator [Planctomycetota bacterium]|nr:MAG: response regulator [Planctomycetota bacterium]